MAKAYRISDRESLYLWVTPSGGKIWRWGYRFDRKEKLMTFGKHPAVSLGQARERHAEARKVLTLGIAVGKGFISGTPGRVPGAKWLQHLS